MGFLDINKNTLEESLTRGLDKYPKGKVEEMKKEVEAELKRINNQYGENGEKAPSETYDWDDGDTEDYEYEIYRASMHRKNNLLLPWLAKYNEIHQVSKKDTEVLKKEAGENKPWKNPDKNLPRSKKGEDSNTWKNPSTTSGKEFAESRTVRPERFNPEVFIVDFNKEQFIAELTATKLLIDRIIENRTVDVFEMENIKFEKIKALLSQAKKVKFEKDDKFVETLDGLFASIDTLEKDYYDEVKTKSRIKNEKWEAFFNEVEQIKAYEVVGVLGFLENLNKKSLAGKLELYKKFKGDDNKRLAVLKSIFENHVEKGEYVLGYDKEKLTILSKQRKKVKGNDDIDAILAAVSDEDLRVLELNKVMKNISFEKEQNPSYRKLIEKILSDNTIVDSAGGVYEYADLQDKNKKDKIKLAIEKKLEEDGLSIDKVQNLNFVLSYMNGSENYSPMVVKNAMTVTTVESAFNQTFTTADGKTLNLKDAFADGNGMSTMARELMATNGGLTGMVLIFAAFILLFTKHRSKVLWSVLGLTGITALEELAKKTGMTDGIIDTGSKAGKEFASKAKELVNVDVEFKIKSLAPKYDDSYDTMYEANKKKLEKEGINSAMTPQDFAQIYGQLVTSEKLSNMDISTLQTKLGKNAELSSFGIDVPTTYRDSLLVSNSEDEIPKHSRAITSDKVKIFLNILLDQNEPGTDVVVGDLFEEGRKSVDEYMPSNVEGHKEFNNEVTRLVNTFPLETELRGKIQEITGKSNEIFGKAGLTFFEETRLTTIKGMIDSLESEKVKIKNTKSKEFKNLELLVNEYQKMFNFTAFVNSANAVSDSRGFGLEGALKGATVYTIDTLNWIIDWAAEKAPSETIATPDKVRQPTVEDIDDVIRKGKEYGASEDFTSEQKKEIEKGLQKLYEKKKEILSGEDTEIETVDTEMILAIPSMMLEKLIDMESAIQKLSEISGDNLGEYSKAISPVVDNIKEISKYKSILDSETTLTKEQQELKSKLEELLGHYKTFKTNFESAVTRNESKITKITTAINKDDVVLEQITEHKSDYEELKSHILSSSKGDITDAIRKKIHEIDTTDYQDTKPLKTKLDTLWNLIIQKEGDVAKEEITFKLTDDFDPIDNTKVEELLAELKVKKDRIDEISNNSAKHTLETRYENFLKEVAIKFKTELDSLSIKTDDDYEKVIIIASNYDAFKTGVNSFYEKVKDTIFDDTFKEVLEKKQEARITHKFETETIKDIADSGSNVLSAYNSFKDTYKTQYPDTFDRISDTTTIGDLLTALDMISGGLGGSYDDSILRDSIEAKGKVLEAMTTDNELVHLLIGVEYNAIAFSNLVKDTYRKAMFKITTP